LTSFKGAQQSLANNKASRDREQQKYEQYQKYYTELVAKKDKLSQRIKELEANQVALETRQATEAAQFDDSAIQEAESFLNELEKDQAVQNNLLDIQKNHGSFEVEPNAAEQGDIVEEVKKALEETQTDRELISTET
jgi:hypothetical protein